MTNCCLKLLRLEKWKRVKERDRKREVKKKQRRKRSCRSKRMRKRKYSNKIIDAKERRIHSYLL
jgi:hypothetical protein